MDVNLHCRMCFFQLHQIQIIRHNASFNAAETQVHSFMVTWTDIVLHPSRTAKVEHVSSSQSSTVPPSSSHRVKMCIFKYMHEIQHWFTELEQNQNPT